MSIADILKSKVNGLLNKKDWDFTPKSLSYRIQEAKSEVEKIVKPTIINKVSKEMAEPAFKLFPDGPSRQELLDNFKNLSNTAKNVGDFAVKTNEFVRTAPDNAIKSLSKNFLYNPETKQAFPSSPYYRFKEINSSPEMKSLAKKEISYKDLSPETKKSLYDFSDIFVSGLTGNVSKTKAVELKADPESLKSLWGLIHSKNTAIKSGLLTAEQAEKMSAQETMALIEQKLPGVLPSFGNLSVSKSAVEKATKNLTGDVSDLFSNWVNARHSTEIAGVKAKQAFKNLDNEGVDAIFNVQSAKEGYENVRNYFDDIYKKLEKSGIKFGYKDNYLPQLWSNSKDEVERVFKTLNPNAPFTKESVLKNYKEGLAAGLSPRFNKVSDLVGWYEKSSEKMLADKTFLDVLKLRNLIKPASKADRGWVKITAEGFPMNRVKSELGEWIDEPFAASPEIADQINNFLNPASFKGLQGFADYNTAIKNVRLSAGIPGTGINAHGANILARATLSRNNPIGGFMDAGKWILNPNGADSFVKQNLDRAVEYSKAGMTLTTEDFAFQPDPKIIDGNILQKSYKVLGQTFDKFMSDPLFRKIIPALKLKYADELVAQYTKSGLSQEEAIKTAARTANNMFGGQNELDRIFKSKDAQNLFRSIVLAPDWLEGTLKIGGNIGKSLIQPNNPILKPYRTFARNFIALFIASQAMDKALSGSVDDPFTMNAGYTKDGQKREVRMFGTAADMFRIPYEVATSLSKGDFNSVGRVLGNRLSLGFGSIAHLIANEDYRGRPILGKDKYGNEIPAGQQASNLFSELSNATGIPSQVTTGIDYLSGRNGLEQSLTQLAELPVRYSGGAYSTSSQKKLDTYKSAGLEGEDLYKAMNPKSKSEGILNWLFNKNSSDETVTESSDPLIKAFNSEISRDKKASRIREIFKDPALNSDRTKIETVLKEEGLGSYEEASYTIAKSLGVENGVRGEYIKEILKGLKGEDYKVQFVKLVDAGVLTTGIINQWEKDGILSESQADSMTKMLKRANGSASAGTSKKKKFAINIPGSLNLPNVKASSVKFDFPTLKALEPIKAKRPEIKLPNYKRIPVRDFSVNFSKPKTRLEQL